jgi:hypothetical protein
VSYVCAWRGCNRTTPFGDLPPGWRWLLTSRRPVMGVPILAALEAGILDRDAVLCPDHVNRLEALLKPL